MKLSILTLNNKVTILGFRGDSFPPICMREEEDT